MDGPDKPGDHGRSSARSGLAPDGGRFCRHKGQMMSLETLFDPKTLIIPEDSDWLEACSLEGTESSDVATRHHGSKVASRVREGRPVRERRTDAARTAARARDREPLGRHEARQRVARSPAPLRSSPSRDVHRRGQLAAWILATTATRTPLRTHWGAPADAVRRYGARRARGWPSILLPPRRSARPARPAASDARGASRCGCRHDEPRPRDQCCER